MKTCNPDFFCLEFPVFQLIICLIFLLENYQKNGL